MISTEFLTKELESALSKARDTEQNFLNLGKAGNVVAAKLRKQIIKAEALLPKIGKVHPLIIKEAIKNLEK